MKRVLCAVSIVTLLVAGCGANKKYVNEQVTAAEQRQNDRLAEIADRTTSNAEQIQRLQALSEELSEKTDKALNQVSGFEQYRAIWQGEVTFGLDKSDLDAVATGILEEAGRIMMDTPSGIAEIVGHTDRTGPATYNYTLGERRASAVKRYLANNFSVPIFRMFVLSQGKDKPVAMPDERNANARNRRVTVTIWAPPDAGQASNMNGTPADTMQAEE
jgi:peptidoglycan-associated lipoprotein